MSRGRHGGSMFADKSRTRNSTQLVKILWSYLTEFKSWLVGVALVILMYTVLATYQPIIIQEALDLLIEDPSSDTLVLLALVFAGVSILVWIFQSLNTWLMAHISTSLIDKIRRKAFDKLVHADMGYHHKNQSGEVTSRVVSDTGEIATGLTVFTNASTQLLLIVATFAILISINWIFAAISLIAVPVAFIISKVVGSIGRRRMLRTRQAYGKVSGKLAENLAGVAIAKSFNQEDRISEEIRELNQKSYEYMKSLIAVFILVFPSISMVSTLLVFGVMWAGGWLYSTSAITIGNIFLATVMVQRFLRPVIDLANNYTQLQASLAALDRITDIFEAEPAIKDSIEAVPLKLTQSEVVFDQVDFAYEKNNLVLSDVSFTISGGSKVALVGHTGAGKTTITSLLMRFYDPLNGKILIDNMDIKDVTLASLNENISLVSQEPYLFADTVLENIRYGKKEATDEDIYDLCQLIGADEFIEALPDGYNTTLVESGKSLSAGQRQMITVARTMLSDPRILVLDEATSRLDAYSESLVQNAQRLLFRGRTTLIIAHRLSTIRDVDYIVVIDDGKIQEIGTHNELIANKGKYAELYNTYYAHQGVQDIEVIESTPHGDQILIKHSEGTVHLNGSIRERVAFYEEQGKKIRFSLPPQDVFVKGDVKKMTRLIDQFIQSLLRMHQMHDNRGELSIDLLEDNGDIRLQFYNSQLTIPDQMQRMMKNPPAGGSMMRHGSPLSTQVQEQGGTFDIVSPLPDKQQGLMFEISFQKEKN